MMTAFVCIHEFLPRPFNYVIVVEFVIILSLYFGSRKYAVDSVIIRLIGLLGGIWSLGGLYHSLVRHPNIVEVIQINGYNMYNVEQLIAVAVFIPILLFGIKWLFCGSRS